MKFLDDLEKDLRAKIDRHDSVEELEHLAHDDNEIEHVSWCLAKMAQNKYDDMRIFRILMAIPRSEPDAEENVLWGLGELAGAGIGDTVSFDIIKKGMSSTHPSVRGMAAWAAGRYRHRLALMDDDAFDKLKGLCNDQFQMVRESAIFALEEENRS